MIYFFCGDNTYELKKATNSLVDMFIAEHGNLALERIDPDEAQPGQIMDSITSIPFLASKKMVVINGVADKKLIEELIVADVPEHNDVIVSIPKVDKRASYYKALIKHSGYKVFDADTSHNLITWITDVTEDSGGSITTADARYLIERVGTNQLMLGSEIEKLVIYSPQITRDSINLLCEPLPQTSVFQLLDAAFAGKKSLVEQIYNEQRAQKVEPHAILGMIVWQLHVLVLVKTAGNKSADSIARDAKLNPFVVRKSISLTRKLTLTEIQRLVSDALTLDILLKSKPVDPNQALQNYLLTMSTS